jgi:hypothetical protein
MYAERRALIWASWGPRDGENGGERERRARPISRHGRGVERRKELRGREDCAWCLRVVIAAGGRRRR